MAAVPVLKPRLVVGLGNPGPEYERTRHNAGFWFVDLLARRFGGSLKAQRNFQGELGRCSIDGHEVWLLKPQTFMNRSGASIRAVCDFYKVLPAEVLVAHDELDLPAGTVRLKQGGGAGGHNGLKDSIAHIGESFWRLRLGIGHPGNRPEVIDYVLKRALAHDEQAILDAIAVSVDEMPRVFTDGAEKVMNKLHRHGAKAPPPVG
jgi:peptidyl-tRNA hydrolase, PTH1 family